MAVILQTWTSIFAITLLYGVESENPLTHFWENKWAFFGILFCASLAKYLLLYTSLTEYQVVDITFGVMHFVFFFFFFYAVFSESPESIFEENKCLVLSFLGLPVLSGIAKYLRTKNGERSDNIEATARGFCNYYRIVFPAWHFRSALLWVGVILSLYWESKNVREFLVELVWVGYMVQILPWLVSTRHAPGENPANENPVVDSTRPTNDNVDALARSHHRRHSANGGVDTRTPSSVPPGPAFRTPPTSPRFFGARPTSTTPIAPTSTTPIATVVTIYAVNDSSVPMATVLRIADDDNDQTPANENPVVDSTRPTNVNGLDSSRLANADHVIGSIQEPVVYFNRFRNELLFSPGYSETGLTGRPRSIRWEENTGVGSARLTNENDDA